MNKKALRFGFWLLPFFLFPALCTKAKDAKTDALLWQYQQYQAHFAAIRHVDDMEANGYRILNEQVFFAALESFGKEEVSIVPAIEETWHRLALFITDSQGNILYKTCRLETNERIPGSMRQPVDGVAAVSFADLNRDGLTDIILITRCINETGEYAGIPYKTGDVLFQAEGSFYRDWRISDKLNRFSMNKSAGVILACVRDGMSAEFLYTASTLKELLADGFSIIKEQCYTRNFEKLGRLQVVPGTVCISGYTIFMVYLVNEQGDIVWSLQPMKDYDSLYSLKGISGRDIDGDGMKDLIVLARYSLETSASESQVDTVCSVYYQRMGGFETDTKEAGGYLCKEEDTMEDAVQKMREYWGWQAEG